MIGVGVGLSEVVEVSVLDVIVCEVIEASVVVAEVLEDVNASATEDSTLIKVASEEVSSLGE